jgi:predicted lipoprotein with Yx(FWY)xxD motif
VRRGGLAALSGKRLAVPAAIAVAVIGFAVLTVVARSPSGSSKGAAGAQVASVTVKQSKLGRILVDARGHTLYLFLQDPGRKSTCYGGCARVWPPALAAGKPRTGPGLNAKKLTTAARRHSRVRQLVYAGHPLYTTDADTKPGDVNGQGFFGTWFVVSPSGRQVGKAKKAGGY